MAVFATVVEPAVLVMFVVVVGEAKFVGGTF